MFYRVRRDLTVDYDDLLEKADADCAAVLIIHYLGFPTNLAPLIASKREGASWALIEDWAHSFVRGSTLELAGGDGEFSVFSFYKQVSMMVGGGLRIDRPLQHAVGRRRNLRVRDGLVVYKRLLDQLAENSGDRALSRFYRWLDDLRRSVLKANGPDAAIQNAPSAGEVWSQHLAETGLPWISRWILGMSDLSEIVARRRQNFKLWSELLVDNSRVCKLHLSIPEDVSPWACPVFLRNRAARDFRLREHNVPLFTFGETLHPAVRDADAATLEDASYLSENLLMLGVHQGLDRSRICSAAEFMNQFLEDDD